MIGSAGEAIVDFTPVEEKGRLTGFRFHLGGSPYNVALGVARLQGPAAFVGRLSTDLFGGMFREHLVSSGGSDKLAPAADQPSSLSFVRWRGADAEYSFHMAGTASTLLAAGDVAMDEVSSMSVYHFGSVALLYTPVRDTVVGLARALKGKALISFDPNVRPSLVTDWDAYRALVRECLALADLVKLSHEDLEALGADPGSLLASGGPVAIVVTHGARGSRIHTRRGIREVPPVPCELVDTIGAGDAYTAGLLAAIFERKVASREAVEALDGAGWDAVGSFAATCSALVCEHAGPALPWREEVERRLRAATA